MRPSEATRGHQRPSEGTRGFVRVVVAEIHTLGARGDDEPVARGHELIVHKRLDDVAQAGRLVDTIEQDDDGSHLVRLQQHQTFHALLVLGELVGDVPDE